MVWMVSKRSGCTKLVEKDYYGYFQGIAVHNGDPMTDNDYDAGLNPFHGGYPSGYVNRGLGSRSF